jgi:uncharacterized protein (DUF952 family)/N-acetylglutamate synthase-like GNAT family acetyltransferase
MICHSACQEKRKTVIWEKDIRPVNYQVTPYQEKYQRGVVDLILPIQQHEFNVPITIQDQPDLQNIISFYMKDNGNFWVAVSQEQVVGTIALIDIGNDQVALRKMFVHHQHRGKQNGVAQLLFDTLATWCKQKKVTEVSLGTIDSMLAVHRFYMKNGFEELTKMQLPENFPVMRVDNKFFKLKINYLIYHITTLAWWNEQSKSNSYRSKTLHKEGFIHCSTKEQVAGVLERYYAGQKELLLLHIDPTLLKSELKFEKSTNDELFPHVFGEINKEAIVKMEEL